MLRYVGRTKKAGRVVGDTINQALNFHQQMLGLRTERQSLIASNIANADTPHYKARDIDFKLALSAVQGRGAGSALTLARTSAGHLEAVGANAYSAAVRYRGEQQSSVDGNTVNLDTERAAFAENALQYEASITFINGILRTQQMAITGQ